MSDLSKVVVMKFGGTSVGSSQAIELLIAIVAETLAKGMKPIVVVSALSGVTNALISTANQASQNQPDYEAGFLEIKKRHVDMAKALLNDTWLEKTQKDIDETFDELEKVLKGVFLLKEITNRTLDLILSFGERCSAKIISAVFNQAKVVAFYSDARIFIKTDAAFGSARVNFNQTSYEVGRYFSSDNGLSVVTGFIASTEKGETTTLGRGGSDYTAAILGSVLNASEIQIWTDVDGMMTADPRIVKKAFSLPYVSYQEAMELSHFGAKVIYPPTLQPAFQKKIPIKILNTFNASHPGTIISDKSDVGNVQVKGLSSIEKIALINLQGSGLVGVAGVAARLFSTLSSRSISVILITQASSEHSICFAIDPKHAAEAKAALEENFAYEIESGKIDPVEVQEELSILAVIGENMKHAVGISGKLFSALGRNGINIVATAQGSSELNISIVIPQKDLKKALNVLHEAFFLSDQKNLNLFLFGPGLIGKTLLNQIQNQQAFLIKSKNLNIKLCGIANSKKMLVLEDGIAIENWNEVLDRDGINSDKALFLEQIFKLNLPNSVVADCTGEAILIPLYPEILKRSIAIVTPNKLANSDTFLNYKTLKAIALKHNAPFLFETNVGAGLPIIRTLHDLIQSGDKLIRTEAILSGTLSFIFNTFNSGTSFASVVREAKAKGYTEPDPRDDLSGKDMARKMLILARESGLEIEMDEIEIETILPEKCLSATSIDAFFQSLETENGYFENLAKSAEASNSKIRFVGVVEDGNVRIQLRQVDASHPFFNLSGADNIISFTTERYKNRPLVVQGPGAGAEVTAAGIFAEIISLG